MVRVFLSFLPLLLLLSACAHKELPGQRFRRQCLAQGEVETQGLSGRLLRGHRDGDFFHLSPDPNRKLVFLMGPKTLGQACRVSTHQLLLAVGYPESKIAELRATHTQFKLVVIPEGPEAKLATWDNVIELASSYYGPETQGVLKGALAELKRTPFSEWQKQAREQHLELGAMGAQKFLALFRPTPLQVRAFLYTTFNLNELYSGDGFSRNEQGEALDLEYVVPNLEVRTLLGEGAALIDLPPVQE